MISMLATKCLQQDSGEDIAVGISANVVSYTISTVLNGAVGTEVNVTIDASNHNRCTSNTCKYCTKNFTVMSGDTIPCTLLQMIFCLMGTVKERHVQTDQSVRSLI